MIKQHINPDQLKMFMTPNELLEYGVSSGIDQRLDETFDELLKRKLDDSYGRGLADNINKRGVVNPVQIIHSKDNENKMIGHGHHRFAVSQRHRPDELIPVVHTEAVENNGKMNKFASMDKYEEFMKKPDAAADESVRGVTDRWMLY